MTLDDFIRMHDHAGTITLLEGKRNVKEIDRPKLIELGRTLASISRHMIFRSGNAAGADDLFCQGVAAVDPERIHVIKPYKGHHKQNTYHNYSLDQIDLLMEPAVVEYSRKHMPGAVNEYMSGKKHRNAAKAAYIIRDTVKVLGTSSIPRATFGIFYDDLDAPMEGGTGHTMRVCLAEGVPVIDQQVWFDWVG